MPRLIALACLLVFSSTLRGAEPAPAAPDNGTDPTKFSNTALANYEHIQLRSGGEVLTVSGIYIQPLGEARKTNLRLKAPFVSSNARGNDDFGFGDLSVKVNHIAALTRAYGIVVGSEFVFDTAVRDELGTGQNVFKPSLTYAKFLSNGWIVAPALQHGFSLWGDDQRSRVAQTVFDFYLVPKLPSAAWFMTIDPAYSYDWVSDTDFASLSVTFGRSVGKIFGVPAFVQAKPGLLIGADRPSDWSVEVSFKIIGF
jgi:hypothetical protein